MQLKKLAVLCNCCFWLTLLFEFWKSARNLQQDVLNTIVILGLVAIVVNLVWILSLLIKKPKTTHDVDSDSNPGMHNTRRSRNQPAFLLFRWFNLLSFVAQLIFLYFKFL